MIITGTDLSGATSVMFGANGAFFMPNSSTQITATAPPNGSTGVVDVRVTTGSGTSVVVAADQFTYLGPVPQVTGVSPSSGPVAGGNTVTLSGSGFTGTTSVMFGATGASFLVSNDGQHFREPVKGHVFMSRRDSAPHVAPDVRYETVLTQSGNGILNVGDETWIYHGRWANTEHYADYHGEVALATLPRDRWGALGLVPRGKEGEVWTAPMTLGQAGCNVSLNADGVKGMSVEIADENFHLLPDYSGINAATVAANDGLDCAVRWSKASLDALVSKPVRLLIHLKKGQDAEPRLFAAYVGRN